MRITTASGFTYWLARSAFRFFVTGRPIAGKGDNATFLHDATTDYRGGPVERLTRARWRRVARRWTIFGVPGALWSMEHVSAIVRAATTWAGNNPPSWAQWPWHGMLWTYLIAAPLVAAGIFAPRAWQQWQSRTLRRE
ncbi:MAG TPA: hypothetical protein VFU47_13000, partial [Armatimonadota bacterium]|nr:hypothetical protein [Armatimonadota bacterium]